MDGLNENYEGLFYNGEDLNLELDPAVKDAISQNPFIQDLFYTSVAEGDMEWANYWGELACEANGVEPDYTAGGTTLDELVNFNPEESNDLYNCSDAMEHWEYQGDTQRCAQMAQLSLIEEITGYELDPDEFCEFSKANGWYIGDDVGTAPENINKMLDYFGIENEMSQGKDFNAILDCLNNGGRVLVAVDSGEYWHGEGFWDDFFDPNGADHVIEVIGVNPETNCVIVNDSGNPNGCGSEIPLDAFLDAWADSGNLMVEVHGVYAPTAA